MVNKDSLNLSLRRLGSAPHLNLPEIFVEHELAIAVSRFGAFRVFRRVMTNWWFRNRR